MPIIPLPLSKGSQVDNSADYRDYLPVNMLPIMDAAPNAQGYFTNHPGLKLKSELTGGFSLGGIFNAQDSTLYRLIGSSLYGNDQLLTATGATGRASFAYSPNSVAFTGSNGKAYYWNGTALSEFKNWQVGENPSGITNYQIDGIIDGTRNLGRYIWLTPKSFIVSDLQNEQRPDYIAPIYSAESDPDDNVAITTWSDFVVVMGRNSTEFFRLTGDAQQIYAAQRSLVVPFGCISTHAKCNFMGGIATVGSARNEPPSIALIAGNGVQKLSTPEIDKILHLYNDSTLQLTVLESAVYRGVNLLYVHLPQETIVYVAQSQTWIKLKSDLGNARWAGIDVIYNANTGQTEAGDKRSGRVGEFIREMSQYEVAQEAFLQTPLVKVGKASVYDLALDSVSGFGEKPVRLSISATENGYTYSAEQTINISEPLKYTNAPIISRIGGVRDKIGFRLRIVGSDPVNISGFTARIENA
jgi:hypothetical protein